MKIPNNWINKISKSYWSRYLLSGGSAFFIEYLSFYILFVMFHTQIYAANSVSFCLGLFVSFTLNRGWTFKKQEFKRRKHYQIIAYSVLALLNLITTNAIVGLLRAQGFDPRLGKIIAMLTIVGWNYFIFKFIIFEGNNLEQK